MPLDKKAFCTTFCGVLLSVADLPLFFRNGCAAPHLEIAAMSGIA